MLDSTLRLVLSKTFDNIQNFCEVYYNRLLSKGVRGVAFGWRHCATSRNIAGSIPDCAIGMFH